MKKAMVMESVRVFRLFMVICASVLCVGLGACAVEETEPKAIGERVEDFYGNWKTEKWPCSYIDLRPNGTMRIGAEGPCSRFEERAYTNCQLIKNTDPATQQEFPNGITFNAVSPASDCAPGAPGNFDINVLYTFYLSKDGKRLQPPNFYAYLGNPYTTYVPY